MTDDNTTNEVDTTDESTGDSPVIKALRQQIKDLEKQVKSSPTREAVEAEVRDELARQSAISEQLVALGHPAGMSDILKGTLGDAEVTRESVAAALQGIGYSVEVEDATSEAEDSQPSEPQSDLAKVTSLSASVRSAAQGGDSNDVMQKLGQAKNQAEIVEIMAGLGALQSHA